MNNDAIKIILTLVIFVMVAAFAIAFTDSKTHGKIIEREKEAQQNSLAAVLSDGSEKVPDSIEGFGRFYRETLDGKTIGYAFMGAAKGYSSTIRFFCGIDTNGNIKGLSIISQGETPGLGTRVVEVISTTRFPMGLFQKREEGEPWFTQQFIGISAIKPIGLNRNGEWRDTWTDEAKQNLLNSNQISVITGSTITTAAITNELSARAKLLISLLNSVNSEVKNEYIVEQTGIEIDIDEYDNGENTDD